MSAVSVAEAQTHLKMSEGVSEVEVAAFIDAAEAAIAEVVGPLEAESTTSLVRGGGRALVLPVAPVISVTSVTPYDGTALVLGDMSIDLRSGLIENLTGTRFADQLHTVVYSAGRASLPADLRLAVLELVRHYWQTQRGGTGRPGRDAAEGYSNTIPGAAYSMPFRVSELIAPHRFVGCA